MRENRTRYLLFLVILVGFILRIWGINFGLPDQIHQDEPIVVNHALAYGTGDLNPHFFAIPPFASYLLFIVYGILFAAGKLLGSWHGAEDFAVYFFRDPSIFYLTGRFFIGALPGVGCVILTYFLGKKISSKRSSLYAAAVMAVAYLNVVNSHYIYTDMLLVAFIVFFYIRLFCLYERPSFANYIAAGCLMGLAVGTKYNGLFLFVPLLITHLGAVRSFAGKAGSHAGYGTIVFSLIAAALVFMIVNPFAFIDYKGFLDSSLSQTGAFSYTGWSHHIVYSLFEGLSIFVTLAGVIGLLFFLRKGVAGLILLSFPAVFYCILALKSQHFARYVLPLIPFLSIGCAYLIYDVLYGRLCSRWTRMALAVISIAVLLPMLGKSVKADMLLAGDDTRVISAEWIMANIPEGTAIACDSTVFRPFLKQPYSQLVLKQEFLNRQEGLGRLKEKKLTMEMKASDKEKEGYPVYFLYEDPRGQGQFLDTIPALAYDLDEMKAEGVEYVSVNMQDLGGGKKAFLKELEVKAKPVKSFSPYASGGYEENKDPVASTCMPVADNELYSRNKKGPYLRLYRIK
ncbi:MAG: glycosyltransferase family 39 protein [Candidatus Tantalella remota]|nr:glycosyltransferase family 39 protein [Candidatus Tantalella remota]